VFSNPPKNRHRIVTGISRPAAKPVTLAGRPASDGEMSADGQLQNNEQLLADLDARFRAPLMAYFLRRTASRSEAEDLTQETFVRLIGAHSFVQAEQANAYVFRVATNLWRDCHRSRARWKNQPLAIADSALPDEIVEDREPERVLIGRERLSEVLGSLDELGARTKSIFVLFRLEGMKQKDIAALYGMGLSTVEKHVMAATVHLAKRFGSYRP
jgi:RNA polymerase sigma-70 factor (ECF subfamily)